MPIKLVPRVGDEGGTTIRTVIFELCFFFFAVEHAQHGSLEGQREEEHTKHRLGANRLLADEMRLGRITRNNRVYVTPDNVRATKEKKKEKAQRKLHLKGSPISNRLIRDSSYI